MVMIGIEAVRIDLLQKRVAALEAALVEDRLAALEAIGRRFELDETYRHLKMVVEHPQYYSPETIEKARQALTKIIEHDTAKFQAAADSLKASADATPLPAPWLPPQA